MLDETNQATTLADLRRLLRVPVSLFSMIAEVNSFFGMTALLGMGRRYSAGK
jgi:hypothetical protein